MDHTQFSVPTLSSSAVEFVNDGRCVAYDESTGKIREVSVTPEFNTAAPEMLAAFKSLVKFPASVAENLNSAKLLADLAAEIEATGCLAGTFALLVASFIASTWVVDSLPLGPTLCFHGDPGSDSLVQQLLAHTCRRALSLGRADKAMSPSLPAGLHPTLFVSPAKRLPVGLLETLTGGLGTFYKEGRMIDNRSAIVLSSAAPVPGTVSLVCSGSAVPYRHYFANDCERILATYVPRLVHYRLLHHQQVARSLFDLPNLGIEARLYARTVGSALEGLPMFQQQLASDLEIIDGDLRAEKSDSPEGMIVDMLWQIAHAGRAEVSLAVVTEGVNAANKWRRSAVITSKKVGCVVRAELQVTPVRRGQGCFVVFDLLTLRGLHRAARRFGLLPWDGCTWCSATWSPGEPAGANTERIAREAGSRETPINAITK
jgi:hypothetical protein